MHDSELEILVVENELGDAEMIIRALRKNNIHNRIVHLKDGKEALDYLFARGMFEGRDARQHPKVVLLDLKMPKVDGVEVLQQMKLNADTREIPVIVLTSSKDNPDMEKCYALGVTSYVIKPLAIEDFVKVVGQLGLHWVLHNNQIPA